MTQPLNATGLHSGKPMATLFHGMGQTRPHFPGYIGTRLTHIERPDSVSTSHIPQDSVQDHHRPPQMQQDVPS